MRTVFSLVAMLLFSIDQSFKRLSKLVRVTGTLENLNLAVNLITHLGFIALFSSIFFLILILFVLYFKNYLEIDVKFIALYSSYLGTFWLKIE
jgi:hypothetical protein